MGRKKRSKVANHMASPMATTDVDEVVVTRRSVRLAEKKKRMMANPMEEYTPIVSKDRPTRTRRTMQDEAMETTTKRQWLGPLSRATTYRFEPIQFVSAGYYDPNALLQERRQREFEAEADPAANPVAWPTLAEAVGKMNIGNDEEEAEQREVLVSSLFAVDVDGVDDAVHTGLPPPRYRETSPSPSSSSEEVITFRGRTRSGLKSPNSPAIITMHPRVIDDGVSVAHNSNRVAYGQVMPKKRSNAAIAKKKTVWASTVKADGTVEIVEQTKEGSAAKEKEQVEGETSATSDEALDDYLANTKEHEDEEGFGDGPFLVKAGLGATSSTKEVVKDQHDNEDLFWGSDAEESVDELEELMLNEEEELLERKMDKMTADRMAKILKTLDKNGISSDELLLRDEEEDESDDEFSEEDVKVVEKAAGINKSDDGNDDDKTPGGVSMGPGHEKGRLPVPFDLSDSDLAENLQQTWENDRAKKAEQKQRRQELHEQGLIGKKVKKGKWIKRRERTGAPMDIDLVSVKNLLMKFVKEGTDEEIKFPAMGIVQRRIVHEMANEFSLTSKSKGPQQNRILTVFKTPESALLTHADVAKVDCKLCYDTWYKGLLNRSFNSSRYTRPSKKDKDGSGTAPTTTKRLTRLKIVSYMDGDVVGAGAPELGADSRGLWMMLKMGWSKGSALGTEGNPGILQPLSHVVKTSKIGLGR
ncbi:MAG: Cysteine protease atg4 [Watsoniomyces obsoletus]|nr:MAG: Cysteine protease atg4 [Watsoniomyces obsoletus]